MKSKDLAKKFAENTPYRISHIDERGAFFHYSYVLKGKTIKSEFYMSTKKMLEYFEAQERVEEMIRKAK